MRRIKRICGAAKALKKEERRVAMQMALFLILLALLRRILSLPVLLRLLDRPPVAGKGRLLEPHTLARLAGGLLNLNIGVFRPNCVSRSLVLFYFLRRKGYPAEIYFGVSKKRNRLDGHSWLCVNGEPLAEEADPRCAFKVTYSYA